MDTPPTGLLPTIQSIRDLMDRDHPAKVPISPYESVAELMDLQMTMWLLRVCHVVCVFGNGLEDQQTWRLLSTAAMLQESLPDVFAPEGQGPATSSRMADLVMGTVGNDLIKQASGDAIAAARQAAMQCLEGSCLRIVSNGAPLPTRTRASFVMCFDLHQGHRHLI